MGNDVEVVYETVKKAVADARAGKVPSIIDCKTYRHHGNNTSLAYHDKILIDTQLCTILENMKPLYPTEYASDFEARIAEYKAEIADLQLLQKHPWLKWLRRNTYTRPIKQWLRNL